MKSKTQDGEVVSLLEKIETLEKRNQLLEMNLSNQQIELSIYKEEVARANALLEAVIKDLGQELQYAGVIQKILSPTKGPHFNGIEVSMKFTPGSKSGGDYYDFFEIEEKLRFAMIMSSSSGYALSSLFLSILLKMTAQLESRKTKNPEQIISQIIGDLVPHMGEKDKTSLFYGWIDLRHFEFHFCNLGLVHAFLISKNKAIPLIGNLEFIHKNLSYSPSTKILPLNPKDRIIICSDGFFSTSNHKGELYKTQFFVDVIESREFKDLHDLKNELLFHFSQWMGGKEVEMDQSIMLIEISDRSIQLAKRI